MRFKIELNLMLELAGIAAAVWRAGPHVWRHGSLVDYVFHLVSHICDHGHVHCKF